MLHEQSRYKFRVGTNNQSNSKDLKVTTFGRVYLFRNKLCVASIEAKMKNMIAIENVV